MHTLFDFVTQVKTVEYLIAVSAIAGFILIWELLKPQPFKGMVETGRDDLAHIRETGGFGNVARTAGKVAAAPIVGLMYIVSLPVVFLFALGVAALSGIANALGVSPSFGWRPMEAYLAGGKKKEKKGEQKEKKEQKS